MPQSIKKIFSWFFISFFFERKRNANLLQAGRLLLRYFPKTRRCEAQAALHGAAEKVKKLIEF